MHGHLRNHSFLHCNVFCLIYHLEDVTMSINNLYVGSCKSVPFDDVELGV